MIKTIAVYLPQFHEVEENNRWWGEGFTDWKTVRAAKPLYKGHREPRRPLNENYYNLLDHATMAWQASIAKQYNISGFSFYHYWFKNGKRILEKPAENLLEWTDIDLPFCFSWANETWARTWANVPNSNTWIGEQYEKTKYSEGEDGILLKQCYGGKKEWKEHFDYLLPFFKDPRYLKYEEKPIFIIYKPNLMPSLDNMMEYWKELAINSGFPGLYIVVNRADKNEWTCVDARLQMEFDYSDFNKEDIEAGGLSCFNYNDAWEHVLDKAYRIADKHVFFGGFTDVDDTPRRGRRGVSMKYASPELFRKYYKKLMDIAIASEAEFIFVNAWNEWGEGAYLEPDEEFGFGYLEAIRDIMEYARTAKVSKEDIDKVYAKPKGQDNLQSNCLSKAIKYEKFFKLLDRWMCNQEAGRKVEDYFKELNFQYIAVYGKGALGKHLDKSLEGSSIKIMYYIDKKSELFNSNEPRRYVKKNFPKIDAVIVTPIAEYKDIRQKLKQIYEEPIISLEEVIYDN